MSGGKGSQTYLVTGTEKTAIVDAGMAYSAKSLIQNIERRLGGRPLDYVLLSHSHYDHVSGIPALLERWPELKIYGGAYTKHVFGIQKAKKLIRELNEDAAQMYTGSRSLAFDADALRIDEILAENDRVSLGERSFTAYETPGHTRCSMAFLLDGGYLFASETTCVISHKGTYVPNYLVSYRDSEESIRKCAKLPARYVLVPHGYIYDLALQPDFWNYCMQEMAKSKEIILAMHARGASVEETVQEFDRRYRDEDTRREQPLEAFMINQTSLIKAVLREFAQEEPYGSEKVL